SLYVGDSKNNRVRVVNGGNINAFAGNGTSGNTGDGGLATAATLAGCGTTVISCLVPTVAASGDVYIADGVSNRVRRVDAAGNISTVAGTATAGVADDGRQATLAQFDQPTGVTTGLAGNVY